MSDIKHTLLKPLKNAEFTAPGLLSLIIGIGIAIVPFKTGWSDPAGIYFAGVAGVLIACGVSLLLRHIVGTVIFVGLLGYWFVDLVRSGLPSSFNDSIGFFLGALMLYSFADSAFLQFKYHRERSKNSSDPVPPPASPQV